VQTDVPVDVAKGLPRQPNIAGVIFDQENLYELLALCEGIHDSVLAKAIAPICDSNERLPKMSLTDWPLFLLLIS
jgi:hypothetical protein